MSDTVVKRLHIGGLGSNITSQHLKERFSSFGTVTDVETSLDGLGQPRTFSYVTINTNGPQLKKCLNIMSGSTWRGSQLRVAEAKPKWEIRLQNERNPPSEKEEERLRKRRKRLRTKNAANGIGKETDDMRPITKAIYPKRKFWISDENGHIVRPIAMRPEHPLPPLPKSIDTDGKRKRPPTRARMRVINPLLYQQSHISAFPGPGEGSSAQPQGDWVFEPIEAEEEAAQEDGQVIIGTWRRVQGDEVVEEQFVKGRRKQSDLVEDDWEYQQSDGDETASSSSDLFGRHQIEETNEGESSTGSPLFSSRPLDNDEEHIPSPSPPIQATPTTADTTLDGQSDRSSVGSERSSSSQIQVARIVPVQRRPQPSLPPAVQVQAMSERSRDLGILSSILGSNTNQASSSKHGKLWFEDSDSEKEESRGVLRLRGGAASSEDEEESDSDSKSSSSSSSSTTSSENSDSEDSSDETTSSDSESDSDDTTDSEATTSSGSDSHNAEAGPSEPKKSNLKDMFSAPSGGFSLMANLGDDIEMDEDLDIPIHVPGAETAEEQEETLEPLQTSVRKSTFDPDPNIPLFFAPPHARPPFSSGQDGDSQDLRGKGGAAPDMYTADSVKEGWKGFWAQETDEEMKVIWERDKLELTREWKKRHREAKKHRRRRGGGEDLD